MSGREDRSDRGQALVMVLAVLFLAAIVATATVAAYVRSTITARVRAEQQRGLHLAEAAVQYALVQLGREGSGIAGAEVPLPDDLRDVTVRVDSEIVGGAPTGRYVVTGTYSATLFGRWPVRKQVRVVAVRPQDFSMLAADDVAFTVGALGWSELRVGADIHANGTLGLERIGLLGRTTIEAPPEGRRAYVLESAEEGKRYVRGRDGRPVALSASVPVLALPTVTANSFDSLVRDQGFRIITGDLVVDDPYVVEQDTIVRGDLVVTRTCQQWLVVCLQYSHGRLEVPPGRKLVVEGDVRVDRAAVLAVNGLLYLPGYDRTVDLVVDGATLTGSGTVAVRGDIRVQDLEFDLAKSVAQAPALIVVSREGSSGDVIVRIGSVLYGEHEGHLFIYTPVPSDGSRSGDVTIEEGSLGGEFMKVGGTIVAGGDVDLRATALLASSLRIVEVPDLWKDVPFLPPELDPGSTVQVLDWQEVE